MIRMRILKFIVVLFFPALLFSQSLRDSKQLFYTISKNELIGNSTSLFTFKLNFKHETPFHCASVAWNENHEREKPNTSFLFSFSKDSIVWTKWESLLFDEHAIDIRDQFATNLIFLKRPILLSKFSWLTTRKIRLIQ